jgi:hypothetical protein
MSWLNILKKNDKEFEIASPIKEEVQEIIVEEPDYFIKNIEEEFEKIYGLKILDIKFDFKEYIKNEALPFMNKTIHNNYNFYDFYDFIKNNCTNYYKLIDRINNENKEYLDSLKEDDHDFFEEFKENNYDNEWK